ncbi:sensor histidine kinase [Pseudonocardia sp.]|uniref:sensor histidine kinase n=1 Tax=Pseudonocardia sp. TaxID=60912 RepID=UPI0026198831|nr:sensor histidine kinase [Pseudonocardia sp.]
MSTDGFGRTRARTGAAFGLFGLVVAEVGVALGGSLAVGMGFADFRDSFALTNSAIALSCAVSGVLIAWQRPRNPLGWVLLAAGVLQGATAAMSPLLAAATANDWPEPAIRTLTTVFLFSWPWSIGLCLPLALLLFPDGRLPGRRWRWVGWATVVSGVLFVAQFGTGPADLLDDARVRSWFELPFYSDLAPLWRASEVLGLAVLLAALLSLVVRYRNGGEQLRRQLLWLVLAVLVMVVALVVWGPGGDGPLVLILLCIAAVPAAMTIAVLRHHLLDIRLAVSRAVLYGLLTAGAVGAYLGLVAVADAVLRSDIGPGDIGPGDIGPGSPLLATLLIAVGFNPVRVRLQRVVDRALYGDRADPVRAVSRLGARLASHAGTDPADGPAVVREALRLPYAALRSGGVEQAADGEPTERVETVALVYRGEQVGELVVGVRTGQQRLDRADRAVLELLAAPLAIAVHATALSDAVQRSREHIVAAREEERRRLRRDLHDGLGPVLTGMTFLADAATNLLRTDPDRALELLGRLRAGAGEGLDDIRRLVHELRPPSLDELGLVGALSRRADLLRSTGRDVVVEAPAELPPLTAAVEVAAFRIAEEALTNAIRHSRADHVRAELVVNGALEVTVTDDGGPARAPWRPGVGMASMRERATEIGGTCEIGPVPAGGRVRARLPLLGPARGDGGPTDG